MLKSALVALCIFIPLGAHAEEPKLPIVASFSILGDMVRQIGGDAVQVDTLVGPDGDAHVYQPRPADAKKLAAAKLFVVNGLGLEGWIARLMTSSGFTGGVVTASDGITPLRIGDDGKRVPDPHAWQDIANGEIYIRNIAAALEAADPPHAADYDRRATAYLAKLAALEFWVKHEIGSVPPEKRKIITTHDAFGYFGLAYGVSFHAPVGMSEDSEPNAAGVAKLIRQIRAERITALFIENMTDRRLLDQIARETGAVVGGELFADALSKPGEGAETYEAMFKTNVPKMVAAMARN
jgi:zinc/manganese transport system substrate-binding protein